MEKNAARTKFNLLLQIPLELYQKLQLSFIDDRIGVIAWT